MKYFFFANLRLVTLLFVLLCSISSSFAQQEDWQNIDYIEQSFYEIALQSEYRDGQTRLRKWQKALLIYVDHQVGNESLHMQLLTMHLDHLESITQFPIEYVNTKAEANLVVYITRATEVNDIITAEIGPDSVEVLRGSTCLANFSVNNSVEIFRALVIIPVDRARVRGKLISCFVEELTQVLGLPNDSENIYPTIFSDRTVDKLLTGLDYLLLKLLYLPDVKIGMNQAELEPIVQHQLREWQKDGTIKNAQKEVMKGELYHLTGYQ